MKPIDALAIVNKWRGDFDAPLIMGFIETESAFNEKAFRQDRNGGSYGLMQLDIPTARDRGFQGHALDLYDPVINVEFGVKQLRWIKSFLAARSASGLQAMIAAYNEGVGNVLRGNPDPRYVASVMSARRQWQVSLGEGVS